MPAFFQTLAYLVAPFLLVIMIIVTVHEFGHYLAARAFDVAIDRFAIGFGRSLISWKDRTGTEWRIGWLPFGGYVKFSGDENAASFPSGEDLTNMRREIVAREGPGAELRYLPFKPLWKRSLIVIAGPVANFLLAIMVFAICFAVAGQPVSSTRIQTVVHGGVAEMAGFHPGDVIRSADGRPMRTFDDLQSYVQMRPRIPIDFVVSRGATQLHIVAAPHLDHDVSPAGGTMPIGRLGLTGNVVVQACNPIQAIVLGAAKTWDVTSSSAYYISRIVTGQASPDQLTSVIGIAHASGAITKQAVDMAHEAGVSPVLAVSLTLLQLIGLISAGVGLFNLLPIPILDGGHLLFHGYEWLTRRPPGPGVQAVGYRVGLALLACLMLFAVWNDLQRLRVFHFFGSLFS